MTGSFRCAVRCNAVMSAASSSFHVLQLVDIDRQRGFGFLGRLAGCLQQRQQVVFEVAIVGQTRFGVEVDTDFDVVVFHLQGSGESRQRAKRPLRQVLCLLVSGKTQQSLTQLGGQDRRQRTVLGCLDPQGSDPGCLRVIHHPVQQYGLAHPSKSDHQEALGGQPAARPLGGDPHRFEQVIAPR